jgi:tetratricopeptide (TPR) repeat protein
MQSEISKALPITPNDSLAMKEIDTIKAEIHHNLGCIGTETNQPEFTLLHFKKFNEMMLAKLDQDTPATVNRLAISWNELGNAYMMNLQWHEGEQCFKQSMEVAQQLDTFDPADFSFPYVNLGLAYWLTNRFDLAQEILEEGLRYREAKYGVDDRQSFM